MFGFGHLYPWSLILQVLALVHFVKRRPENYWLWIILLGQGLGDDDAAISQQSLSGTACQQGELE